ncbi:MAG: sulfatase [Anaerolineae bacterium]|nr:sulfatase [Anaerolineae bacterium]
MGPRIVNSKWFLPALLVGSGLGAVVVVFAADLVGIGDQAGLGKAQIALLVVGIVLLLGGVGLATPAGQRASHNWSTRIAALNQPERPWRETYFRLLSIAARLGLISGLAEGIIYWIFSIVPGNLGWKQDLLPEILWIAPVLNGILFMVLGSLAAVLARGVRRLPLDLVGYAVFGWLAIYGPLLASGRVHRFAAVLLATGLTLELLRRVSAQRRVNSALLARSVALFAVFLALPSLAGITFGARDVAPSGLHPVLDQPEGPNILLIVLDTLRADRLSAYGYARPTTPHIDQFAREGVLFERAYVNAPWTLPSHATFFTGRYAHEHGAGGRPLDTRYPTLAEGLYARGYATAGFSANTYFVTPASGLARGFGHFEIYFSSPADMVYRTFYGKLLLSQLPLLGYYDVPGRKHANEVNQEFLTWAQAHRGTPFFAFLNYMDVHDPHIAPSPYNTTFTESPVRGDRFNSLLFPNNFTGERSLTPEEIQAEVDGYDASLTYLDAELANLFARLTALGLMDDTIVIITSDHGDAFGDHGLYGHGYDLYQDVLHVPFIVRYPAKIPAGLRVSEVVSLQALPATVMDLVGLRSESSFPGKTLVPCWTAESAEIPCSDGWAFASSPRGVRSEPDRPLGRRGAIVSLVTSDWHLILHEEGKVELYRTREDVKELNNLAATPEGERVVREIGPRIRDLVPAEDWELFRPLVEFGAPDGRGQRVSHSRWSRE